MNRSTVASLLASLAAILVYSVACSSATGGSTKWEYNLGTVQFDAECATQALSPYKAEEQVKTATDLFGFSHYAIGQIWQLSNCYGSTLPNDMFDQIMSSYVTCGQQAFDAYAGTMGDAGWEMVSYGRMQHTTPGSQYCSSVVTDYGYEVMWKRPKSGG